MATAPAVNYKSRLYHLFEAFKGLDKEVIQSVAEHCNYDMDVASNVLGEMMEQRKLISKTKHLQNGTKPKQHEANIDPYFRLINFIRDGYKVLILMRGLPGSGKSTMAFSLLRDALGVVNCDEFIFSTDHYFYKTGEYKYDAAEIENAHHWNQRRCFSNLKRGVSPIIIDNTNIRMWEMEVYCKMAVQFSYIIEILEPKTTWALEPNVLSQKNTHGVDKDKIKAMKGRYERNVTIADLFANFKLHYEDKMPQHRKYPPIPKPIPDTPSIDAINKPKKKQSQLPLEYVHQFNTKRAESPKDIADIDTLLSLKPEPKYNDQSNVDLISFINEHKPSNQVEEPLTLQSDLMVKLQDKKWTSKLIDFVSNLNLPAYGTTSDTKMEVDESASAEVPPEQIGKNSNTPSIYPSLRGLNDLEEENQKLKAMMEMKTKPKGSTNPFSRLIETETKEYTPQNLRERRLQMFIKNSGVKIAPPKEFDIVNLVSPTTPKSPIKTQKGFPLLDSKAWGLTEDAVVSWDNLAQPVIEFQPPMEEAVSTETCEQATNTTSEDFKSVAAHTGPVLPRPLTRETLVITEKLRPEKRSAIKKLTLDKSSMTDDELLLGLNLDEAKQIEQLIELFPGVAVDDILDVYDKCGKDFHWTVDLISTSPMSCPSVATSNPKKEVPNTPDKSLESASCSFELNDWTVVSAKVDDSREADETAAKKKKDEEEAKQKNQDEVNYLKKQLEKRVTIGKEHYSDHVWKMKTSKMGLMPPSHFAKHIEESEKMTVDDDMIYISDESSDNDDDSVEDDLVELNLGVDLVQQLESMYGQLTLSDSIRPVVQVPEALARQLHAHYLESMCRQIENQSEYIASQLKKDEEFAMKLQEAERRFVSGDNMNEIMDEELAMNLYKKNVEQRKNLSPETLAMKLTKQKLHAAFPTIDQKQLDEILEGHGNNYTETIQAIIASTGLQPASENRANVMEPPISESTLREMKVQAQYVNKATEEVDDDKQSAQSYRDQANRHMQKYKELQELARGYWHSHNYAVTMFYSDLAQVELNKADLANQHAAQSFIRETSARLHSDTIDLHFQYAEGALTSLDVFLDYQISNLRKTKAAPFSHFFVITGWGKHNKTGKSVLKPLVIKRLKQRNISFFSVNKGMLKIKLLKNLPMSTDIRPSSIK